ncbi:hypothetical protein EUX98_g3002 [Antrodiella citrinella]|uniref:DNA polymerase alpha subunit B n=1 Tax=Antrodiella citrinella TaxID=2447956 RepID=A0A4S4N0C0_9APHY|nr:hypothetical protein EUX98_g3002 [Antrodiella citrinella]
MAASQASIEDIRTHFGEAVDDDDAAECVKLCKMYNRSAADLFYTWEAMNLGFGLQQRVNILNKASLDGLREYLKRKTEEGRKKVDEKRAQMGPLLRKGLMKSGGGTFAASFAMPGRVKTEQASSSFVGNPFGGSDKDKKRVAVNTRSNVTFTLDESSSSSRKYRYMYEKVSERSEVLDDRIEELAQLVKEHYDIPEFGDPSATTEEDIIVVGRVTLDYDSSSSGPVKLNEASLALETSRAMGSGVRVPFKFDASAKIRGGRLGAGGIGLFPGAIVALRGKNGGGGWFMVSEVLSLPVPNARVKADEDAAKTAFSVCIACGPFTTDSDLKFRPWQALIAKLKDETPDIVVLVGPFIDATHPLIKQGEVDTSPEQMFKDVIINPLQDYMDSKESSLVILVPSVKDVVSDHAVFPQAALDAQLFNDPRIRCVPNPSRFKLNDVTFAVSSVDVLFHLRKEEFFKRALPVTTDVDMTLDAPHAADPMANLCRHLLEQRSYYPIFPAPQEMAHEVNLDITHSELLNICARSASDAPEVLISPSRLKQFSKHVDGTTFVNPSFLTKGTYAMLRYDAETAIQVEIPKLA